MLRKLSIFLEPLLCLTCQFYYSYANKSQVLLPWLQRLQYMSVSGSGMSLRTALSQICSGDFPYFIFQMFFKIALLGGNPVRSWNWMALKSWTNKKRLENFPDICVPT